ncbi:MAG TPA: cytidine deaminase, partial [Nannocystis exedens]|nr:cytidine deaminase [Nannocystis exedens]
REKRLAQSKFTDASLDEIHEFMRRDAKDTLKYGQRVSGAFHLAHYFLNNSEERKDSDGRPNKDWKLPEQLTRLKQILTHHDVIRPFTSETAMFAAQGAQLRSACLSRQVGASVVDTRGNVVALGTNEVPRAGGGVYGEGYEDEDEERRQDHRCVRRHDKYCSNSREQSRIVEQLVTQLKTQSLIASEHAEEVRSALIGSRIGGLLEFSRAVHAEMDALLSLARRGLQTVGTRVFVTTFPCHYCARHLVAAGVDEVQYIEPYPKSKALELHTDSISIRAVDWTPPSKGGDKVLFHPFVGVAPRLYAKVFTKARDLKNAKGIHEVADPEWAEAISLGQLSYIELEVRLLEDRDV